MSEAETSPDSYTFVLVHGGCHDGSLWQPTGSGEDDEHNPTASSSSPGRSRSEKAPSSVDSGEVPRRLTARRQKRH